MGQQEKAQMYNALKEAGVPLEKHYRNYTEDELRPAYTRLLELQAQEVPGVEAPEPTQAHVTHQLDEALGDEPVDPEAAAFFGFGDPAPEPEAPVAGEKLYPGTEEIAPATVPMRAADPNEMAGQRLNQQELSEPIRTDEQGRVWFQEEVLKPAYPKPRGRRVLQYVDTGTKTVRAKAGDFVETFEVAGDQQRISEVRVTLPSYQVGLYADPRFPFRVWTYNGKNGFDYFEVQEFYGGAELVPAEIKRTYVENVLCYDIRTTVRAIEQEARHLQLQGKI